MKRAHLIVNPAAGGGRAARRADGAAEALRGVGYEVVVAYTGGPGDATRLAAEADTDVVVAAGGDGTLHEVVNGLVRPNAPALAVWPVGTGNSFGRDYGLHTLEGALGALTRRAPKRIDLLRLEADEGNRYSLNLVGLGFAADAGATTNRSFKALGALGYIAAVAVEVARLHTFSLKIRVDGGNWSESTPLMWSACNSRYTGGTMKMAPNADAADGEMDLIALAPMGRLSFLMAFPKIFSGTHLNLPTVATSRARRVEFGFDGPVPTMIDGEALPLTLRAIEVVPLAVAVLT